MRIVVIVALVSCAIRSFGQASNAKKNDQTQPFILGVIDQIASTELSETRILNIYLPEGYTKNDTAKYPVVYLLDGSADEDFIHIIGLYQFNNFAWINRVPKSIIVGIANVDRKRDFTFPTTNTEDRKKNPTSGHSDKFLNFIEKELQPYIQTKYRTNSSKTIIGQSLGGLLATEILLKKPLLFNKYIIISPSLWWDNGSLLAGKSALLQKNFPKKTDIYIGVGKEGLTPGTIPRVMEVDANLLADKLRSLESSQITVHFDYLPQEDHATVTHQAVFNALRLLYPVIHTDK
ncbi:alpha/beta hydrolase [Spirosoma endbachense]|uniref:Alpha/beta hydrolase n=1 Tax=Spirosoma endbachense TaxID=2666025 RepID=A0A6P1VY69_9BACT|nr:alpha/beta hydrolase-fold protein [Spirosoma endbachense]QHV96760.1 alpha/beta hydrolase [Spirosoma endbachense]